MTQAPDDLRMPVNATEGRQATRHHNSWRPTGDIARSVGERHCDGEPMVSQRPDFATHTAANNGLTVETRVAHLDELTARNAIDRARPAGPSRPHGQES
jgi:hypothetical protein